MWNSTPIQTGLICSTHVHELHHVHAEAHDSAVVILCQLDDALIAFPSEKLRLCPALAECLFQFLAVDAVPGSIQMISLYLEVQKRVSSPVAGIFCLHLEVNSQGSGSSSEQSSPYRSTKS